LHKYQTLEDPNRTLFETTLLISSLLTQFQKETYHLGIPVLKTMKEGPGLHAAGGCGSGERLDKQEEGVVMRILEHTSATVWLLVPWSSNHR
jgi:hypothetical protein